MSGKYPYPDTETEMREYECKKKKKKKKKEKEKRKRERKKEKQQRREIASMLIRSIEERVLDTLIDLRNTNEPRGSVDSCIARKIKTR